MNILSARVVPGIFCGFLLCGCKPDKIALPDTDRTPPTCSWEVHMLDNNDEKKEFPNGGVLDVGTMYNVRVYFKVTDNDGGVKKIKVNGGGTTAYPERTTHYDWGTQNQLSWQEDYTQVPDAQNMVLKSAVLASLFDFKAKPGNGPDSGLQLQVITPAGGTLLIKGSGENYHGGTCSSQLTIKATPPAY
jgi:hypothetical protein